MQALLVLVPLAQYQCCRPLQPNWAVHCSTPGMQSAEDQCNRVSMFCQWSCVPQQCCRPKQPNWAVHCNDETVDMCPSMFCDWYCGGGMGGGYGGMPGGSMGGGGMGGGMGLSLIHI